MRDEVDRHEQNEEVEGDGDGFVGEEERGVVDAMVWYHGVPVCLDWCAAEDADQELELRRHHSQQNRSVVVTGLLHGVTASNG